MNLLIPGGSWDLDDAGDEGDAIPSSSGRWLAASELERFDLGTSDVDRLEGEDGDDADAGEGEEASQPDYGSMQNMEDWGHIRFNLGTRDVDGYGSEDSNNADPADEALEGNDGSTQNVEDWGHSTRQCEDCTVYFRHVKYDNCVANETASDPSEAKTVLE